jgi:hypothetical protein
MCVIESIVRRELSRLALWDHPEPKRLRKRERFSTNSNEQTLRYPLKYVGRPRSINSSFRFAPLPNATSATEGLVFRRPQIEACIKNSGFTVP